MSATPAPRLPVLPSFIAEEMTALGLLFLRFLLGRGWRLVDEFGDDIEPDMLVKESQRFGRGEK